MLRLQAVSRNAARTAIRNRNVVSRPIVNTSKFSNSFVPLNSLTNRVMSTETEISQSTQTPRAPPPVSDNIKRGSLKLNKTSSEMKAEVEAARKRSMSSGDVKLSKPTTPGTVPSSLKSSVPRAKQVVKSASGVLRRAVPTIVSGLRRVINKFIHLVKLAIYDRPAFMKWVREVWAHVKEEAHHYWLGFKLLWSDIKTSGGLLRRVLRGNQLSRRERKQLVRTTGDLFRLVPFSFFIIVPFMEFLLPVAIKLFPNMLPSQFQSSLKREEEQKKVLQLRIGLASFLQETAQEMGTLIAAKADDAERAASAKDLLSLIEAVRNGERVGNDKIIQCAKLFKDELTLDNVSRPQLVAMAKYMGLNPYGTDAFLRYQLRAKIRTIKQDDKQILWEGLTSLSKDELKAACEERGMRAIGLSEDAYRRQLEQWLELSVNQNIPTTLLILSRAFTIAVERAEKALQESISSLDEDVLKEAVLDAAKEHKAEDERALRKMRLESIEHQNEMIEMERQASEAAATARELAKTAEEKQEQLQSLREKVLRGEATHEELLAAQEEAEKTTEAAAEAQKRAQQQYLRVRTADESGDISEDEQDLAKLLSDGPILDPKQASALGEAHGLTSDAIKALEVLASESSVLRERALLARVKGTRMKMEARDMLARGRIGRKAPAIPEGISEETEEAAAVAEGKEVSQAEEGSKSAGILRVKKSLDRMLASLESDLQNVEASIGDKLHILDKDRDGILTAEELHDAVKMILLNNNTDEAATTVVKALDADKDGLVTKEDIVNFAQALAAAEAESTLRDVHDEPVDSSLSSSSRTNSHETDTDTDSPTSVSTSSDRSEDPVGYHSAHSIGDEAVNSSISSIQNEQTAREGTKLSKTEQQNIADTDFKYRSR